jgi:CubicO group peptidase (beta-lactamase class C family)
MPADGFDTSRLAEVAMTLQQGVDMGQCAGLVTATWRKGKLEQLNVMGYRNVESKAPMRRDTIFRIASMTKPITAAAFLILLDEGKLRLDDPIKQWAPEFANARVLNTPLSDLSQTRPATRDITIEDLLTHRSGLSYGFLLKGPLSKAYEAVLGDPGGGDWEVDPWLRSLGALPLDFDPGEQFAYGHSSDVAGFIVGRISGLGFRGFVKARILDPLGMVDTDFYVPPNKRERAASVYMGTEQGALIAMPLPDSTGLPQFCSPGGGLVSTVDDYSRFALMLLGEGELNGVRLYREETARLMNVDRLTAAQHATPFMGMDEWWSGQGMGLSVWVVTDPEKQAWMGAGSKGAFGWAGAFGTWFQVDPLERMVMIYLTQHIPASPAQAITGAAPGAKIGLPAFQRLTYEALTT